MPNLFVHDIGVARDFLEAAGASGLNIKSGQHYGRKPVVCVKDAHIPDGAWLMQHGQVAIVQFSSRVLIIIRTLFYSCFFSYLLLYLKSRRKQVLSD